MTHFFVLTTILGTVLFARPCIGISYPNVIDLPQYSCKITNKSIGQFCSAVRVTSDIFFTAAHCASNFDDTVQVECPDLINHSQFRTSGFKVNSTLVGGELVAIQSMQKFDGVLPVVAKDYNESNEILQSGLCYAFGYGLGATQKIAFQPRNKMLPNNYHRGYGPVSFGISMSSDIFNLIGKHFLLEYEKTIGPGDSGGPLICFNSGVEYLVGVHIMGSQPNVFADRSFSVNLSFYNHWVTEILKDSIGH